MQRPLRRPPGTTPPPQGQPVQRPIARPAAAKKPMPPRLPGGSEFTVTYQAAGTKWGGCLTVPVEGSAKTFTGEARTVFTLLSRLDTAYRKWLKEKGAKPS